MKHPFYFMEQSFILLELDELFDGNRVREKYIHVAKTGIRESDHNPRQTEYPEIHAKAWGYRYALQAGCADYVLPNSTHGVPMMVIVDGDPMKRLILKLIRDLAIFL